MLFASPVLGQPESKAPARSETRREFKTRARGWERVSRAGLTSAAESARADAMEQLVRRIGALRITPARRVDAFMANSDDVARDLRDPFSGVTFSTPRYGLDQVCTVGARVSIGSVINHLKLLNRRYPTGRFDDRDWDRIRSFNPDDIITVVGRGAPALAQLPRRVRVLADVPTWAIETRAATGVSTQPASRLGTPAGKLIAVRRATARARRDLADQLRALSLPGACSMTVGGEMDRHRELSARIRDWIDNARIVDRYWRDNGDAVVRVEADLSSLWALIAPRRLLRAPVPPVRSPFTRPREHKHKAD